MGSMVLAVTVVDAGLAAVQDDLPDPQEGVAWGVNGYPGALAGWLLLSGRRGELLGRRRVLLAGLVLFTVASLLCVAAQSPALLFGARFLPGIRGALAPAVVLVSAIHLFPS